MKNKKGNKMGYQFIHSETYSRKKTDKKFSVKEILEEAKRTDGACPHVPNPEKPNLVFGMSLDDLESLHDEKCSSMKMTNNKGQSRSIRKDQQTLGTVILSYPNKQEGQDEQQYSKDYEKWKTLSIDWLKEKYGDELKTVVEHVDESHPHLHAYLLPEDAKADKYNIGRRAKTDFLKSDESKKLEPKEANKVGDRVYKQAWREWQDSYYEKVAIPCGLARIGPGKRRLSRAEWQQENQQAQSLKKVLSQKNNFVSKTKKEAFSERDKIIQEAKKQADKILADADQQLAKIKDEISQEEEKLSTIRSHWFVKRLYKNIREEGFTEGIKKSSSQISKLKKSIKTLKKEKENLIKEKEFSEELRRKDLLSSDETQREKQLLKDKISSLEKDNKKLSEEKEDYKNKYADLDNKLSLPSSKNGYKK